MNHHLNHIQKEQWKQCVRQAMSHAGALPLDAQQLDAIISLVVPAVMRSCKYRSGIRSHLLSDAAKMLAKLSGENLKVYAETFAVLAQAELDKDESVTPEQCEIGHGASFKVP